jgi:anionic cell wall polymer biosynthesis LytR-Cps2A-Psr (LCP) family protein
LGGVDFDVPQRMKYTDPMQDLYIDLQPGMQHLDGDKAEQLVRFRSYPFGDIDRIKVQQNFLHAIAEQKLKVSYVGKIDDIYSVVIKNLETSMSPDDLVQCGKQLLDVGTENISTVTLPHSFVNGETYVVPVYSEIENIRENDFGYGADGEDDSEK